VIPSPLWVVLFFISIVIFVYMLFFADSGEGAVTQAVLMGSVASVIVAMLLLIRFLDSPFHEGVGGVKPVAMERTLRIIDESLGAAGIRVSPPCDGRGAPAS
jgi:sugar phosphate permease